MLPVPPESALKVTAPLYRPLASELAAEEKPMVTLAVAPLPLSGTFTGPGPPLMEIHG